ncbi:Calx-beta domain-containing protein [Nostoc sp.]|uniref:Calx-beta domain-containing protein n=1 Tax=Nostoc sp. TaxID=1180 RepID=UPI002FFC70BD
MPLPKLLLQFLGATITLFPHYHLLYCWRNRLKFNKANLTEGNSGTQAVTFMVTRSGGIGVASTIDYAFSSAAIFGSDYNNIQVTGGGIAASGTLNFAVGEKTKTITVDVLGDNTFELNEDITVILNNPNLTTAPANSTITNSSATVNIINDDSQPTISISDVSVSVNLFGATNTTITDSLGVATITNDDQPPAISIADVSVKEGITGMITNANFVVTLSNEFYQRVIVNYSTSDGTAQVADSDYNFGLGTIIFDSGETSKVISIGVRGDNKVEPNETFFVNIYGAANAIFNNNQGVGTIKNYD